MTVAKVTVMAPLNGAATELFTCDMFGVWPVAGSTSLTTAEPWLPAGQAVVVAYVIEFVTGPEGGLIVSAPGWVPTAAFACAAPSSDAPATSAPAPSSTAVRLSRFRRKIGIPFMEGSFPLP